jgi:hypothetical protein
MERSPNRESATEELVLATLAAEVREARAALLKAARSEPSRWWTATELRAEAQLGWPPVATTIALNRLVGERLLETDASLRLRAVG